MELIPGEIYYFNTDFNEWIFKFTFMVDDLLNGMYVIVGDKTFAITKNLCPVKEFKRYKPSIATTEQKAHLQACIDAGQYVEPLKSLSYDIF